MQAYCVKCRAKKEMRDSKPITMKNGKPANQGTCPSCGTKMFRIGKAQYIYSWWISPIVEAGYRLADIQPPFQKQIGA